MKAGGVGLPLVRKGPPVSVPPQARGPHAGVSRRRDPWPPAASGTERLAGKEYEVPNGDAVKLPVRGLK